MTRKKILIIDDSALMRRVISDIIESDGRFHVIGAAINGLDGLSMLQEHVNRVDAVLLDINMPRMNGIDFLSEIKRQNIKISVIVVSSEAKSDAKETIHALDLGAYDFVTKPESIEELKSRSFAERVLECLAMATNLEPEETAITPDEEAGIREVVARKPTRLPKKGTGKLVAIACSTGGPKALHTILPSLPENLDAAVLIVQHMPEGFTKSLADRLNLISKIRVKEAEHGELVKNGTVYIAKGGHQLRVARDDLGIHRLHLSKEAPRHGLLPCADIMYESLEKTDYSMITCVVLTGMGSDGTQGIIDLSRKKSIYVIAQDKETSIVYGMPKMVKDTGLVDEVAALGKVSDAIIKNVGVQ